MECSEALDLLYESFDAQITPQQASLLNGHRRTCFACAATLAKAQRFQDLIRRVPQLTVPRGLESRIVSHVFATVGKQQTMVRPKVQRRPAAWLQFRPVFAMSGVLAASFAVFFIVHSLLSHHSFLRPPDQTVTASIQGTLQATTPTNQTREVAEADTPLTTGEIIRPIGAQPAIVSITPHLAVTMSGGSEIQVSKLHRNLRTGLMDAVYLRLHRGTIRINEILHRDVSPVHVATTVATFVPTGTVFSITAKNGATDLSVTRGSVEVSMPGRSFNVIAGHQAHITRDGVLRSLLKPLKLRIK